MPRKKKKLATTLSLAQLLMIHTLNTQCNSRKEIRPRKSTHTHRPHLTTKVYQLTQTYSTYSQIQQQSNNYKKSSTIQKDPEHPGTLHTVLKTPRKPSRVHPSMLQHASLPSLTFYRRTTTAQKRQLSYVPLLLLTLILT